MMLPVSDEYKELHENTKDVIFLKMDFFFHEMRREYVMNLHEEQDIEPNKI